MGCRTTQTRIYRTKLMRKPEKVLVTGGGGFLGKAIVRRLLKRGDQVTSLSRGSYPHLVQWGVDHIQGDIVDPDTVDMACRDMDVVIHTAAKAGIWGRKKDYFEINVTGTQNVIRACHKHRVKRLVYTSSPSVVFNGKDMEGVNESIPYPNHYDADYPASKAAAEQLIRKAARDGLPTISLRPHLIWGPEDNHLVPRIIARAKSLRRVGDGLNLVDTIYIDNAAEAHLLAADRLNENPNLAGRVYFISQGEPIRLWEMVDAILAAGGLEPVTKSISRNTAWRLGLILETVYKILHIKSEPRMTPFVANELATSHWFNISAARSDLGYVPEVSTEEGLRRLAQWLHEKRKRQEYA